MAGWCRRSNDFFELGGNSLLVVHALGALRERGLSRVTVSDFYAHSTAALFVTFVEELAAGTHDTAWPGRRRSPGARLGPSRATCTSPHADVRMTPWTSCALSTICGRNW
ncbi:acyl carrier protein [Streptomyces sp. CA-243310]|uniref:acyl carrier protein n=1 Tax=Streptomyces sp. CA-243310 TaxID=3240056 RepID=UPI003D9138D3